MRVFVTGATGFIGRALIPRLQRDGHAVTAWVRSPARARGLLGAEVELAHADAAPDALVAAIERAAAVVNLAGEPLMGGRWTAARRAVLEESRITVTEQLVRAMAEATTRPRVFISGSAVAYDAAGGSEASSPLRCGSRQAARARSTQQERDESPRHPAQCIGHRSSGTYVRARGSPGPPAAGALSLAGVPVAPLRRY